MEEAHAHSAGQLMYILSSHLTIGDETYAPGTVVPIPSETVHGPLKAGPEGVEFILISMMSRI